MADRKVASVTWVDGQPVTNWADAPESTGVEALEPSPGTTAEAAPVARSGKALYLNDADDHTVQTAVAAAQWARSPLVTDDDLRRPLWTFLYDVEGAPGTADNSGGIWHLYDGPVTV